MIVQIIEWLGTIILIGIALVAVLMLTAIAIAAIDSMVDGIKERRNGKSSNDKP